MFYHYINIIYAHLLNTDDDDDLSRPSGDCRTARDQLIYPPLEDWLS